MQVALHKLGLYRMIMGRKIEPQQNVEKNKFLNRLNEVFDFMCNHISRDLYSSILRDLGIQRKLGIILNLCLEKEMSFEAIFWRMSS